MRIPMILMVFVAGLAACAGLSERAPADAFMAHLSALCGQSFKGRLVTSDPADASFAGQALVMGVVACDGGEVSIPFAVGENRSRTWVIGRTATGVRLKHVHRHDDGTEDGVSRYGGDTIAPGTASRQEFPADDYSKQLFKANKLERSTANVWALDIVPGQMFAYELRREGRFFRVEFDLTRPAG